MEKKNSSLAYGAYLVVGAAVLLLMYMGFLIFRPVDILEIKNEPLEITPKTVMAGEIVTAKMDYCKKKDVTSNITINFIGETIVPSLQTQQHFPLGCHVRDLKFTVPASAPTGEYVVRFNISYQANALNEETYEFTTGPFQVVNR